MKLSRTAAVLIGLVLGLTAALPALPVEAADAQVGVSLALRWGMAGTQGTWTPYVVTVRNPGSSDFSGDVYLVPTQVRNGPPNVFPVHHARVVVARGGERSLAFYVVDAPNGYEAQVRDLFGRVVAQALAATAVRGSSAFGILSDLPQADQKIAAPLHSFSRVDTALARFATPQAFPTNAVYLSGLNGIIVDQFDSAALSQAQLRALADFVGLGGTLVEAGGASWRRTLLPLPAELLPLQPSATETVPLSALTDLAGFTTDAVAQAATGRLRGARTVLAGPGGTPLVVESDLGAGHVIELAFDPFGEPFDGQPNLAGLAWSQALNRALSSVQGAARGSASPFGGVVFGGLGGTSPTAGPGGWAPGWGAASQQLYEMLNDTPAAGSPPVGLLGGLLVAYVLLAGLLNYLFLKTIGRRGLMWVSVPLIGLVFTAGAYVVGFGLRGSDFYVSEVQVQRLAPGGTVEAYSFRGVFSPHRGDVTVELPAGSLASTAVTMAGFGDMNNEAQITEGSRPQVLLQGVAVWNMRTLQSLSVTHSYATSAAAGMPIEAHLRAEGGKLKGSLQNRSSRLVRSVEVFNSTGGSALLTPQLQPGATVDVSAELASGGAGSPGRGLAPPGSSTETGSEAVLRLASTQALGGRPGELALVGLTQPIDQVRIDGATPSRTALAALVEPVSLESTDTLSAAPPRSLLVSSYDDGSVTQTDVYDLQLPTGIKAGPKLSYVLLDAAQSTVRSVEVYDWTARTWRALPAQTPPYKGPQAQPLTVGEWAGGTVRVRVRVRDGETYQANLSVTDQ